MLNNEFSKLKKKSRYHRSSVHFFFNDHYFIFLFLIEIVRLLTL